MANVCAVATKVSPREPSEVWRHSVVGVSRGVAGVRGPHQGEQAVAGGAMAGVIRPRTQLLTHAHELALME